MAYPSDWRVGGVPIIVSSKQTTRILMPDAVIFSGRGPAPTTENKDKKSHESSSFAAVFMNNLAREAMVAVPRIDYPRGSIIVREKLTHADDTQAELLAVMIKRARGFNPAANDWEFLVTDGELSKIRERQKKGSCLDCHASQRAIRFCLSADCAVSSPISGGPPADAGGSDLPSVVAIRKQTPKITAS